MAGSTLEMDIHGFFGWGRFFFFWLEKDGEEERGKGGGLIVKDHTYD